MKHKLAAVVVVVGALMMPATGLAASQPRDNSSNSMVTGGAYSTSELATKLNTTTKSCDGQSYSTTLLDEYQSINPQVTSQSLKSSNLRNGYVTKSGNVVVDGKVVATGAMSYGRCDIGKGHGSTKVGHLYQRSTSVSFQQDKLDAFVYMPNGKFSYAIVKACGNIVKAAPKAPAQKTVTKTVPAQPTIIVAQTQTQVQTQTQPVPAPAPQPVHTLPQTGAGLAGLLGTTAIGTTGWYYLRSRKQLAAAKQNISL